MGMGTVTDTCRKGDHAVHLYSSDRERLQTIVDMLDWMEKGEVLVYLSTLSENELLKSSHPHFREIEQAIGSGKMILMDSYSFYCQNGKFDCQERLEKWNELNDEFMTKGYTGMVVVGDLSWLAGNSEMFSKVMQYEAKVTMEKLPETVTAICQYDSRLFNWEEMERINSVHELRLDGRKLIRNYWTLSSGQP